MQARTCWVVDVLLPTLSTDTADLVSPTDYLDRADVIGAWNAFLDNAPNYRRAISSPPTGTDRSGGWRRISPKGGRSGNSRQIMIKDGSSIDSASWPLDAGSRHFDSQGILVCWKYLQP